LAIYPEKAALDKLRLSACAVAVAQSSVAKIKAGASKAT
jgi:hypothetical protein